MYNNKIKTSFVSFEMLKARANKTGFYIIIVHFKFVSTGYNTIQ